MPTDHDHEIEFSGEKTVPIGAGQSILDASLQAGIPHFHACGGNAKCSTCRILVLEGMENLSPINGPENELRKKLFFPENVRLACQSFVTGEPVRVKRIIRDGTDVSLYVHDLGQNGDQRIGKEINLALFFLDIKQFTPFMERLLPFDVIHIIRRLFMLFEHAIGAHDGKIIETAGDGLYAIFGSDTSLGDAASNAFAAGKSIQKALKCFNEDYLEPYFSQCVQVGIGVHAGKVIAGTIQINKHDQITVMGLPVIVAARLQTATRELNNDFIASDYAYSLMASKPEAVRKTIRLKGLSETQDVYLLGSPFEK